MAAGPSHHKDTRNWPLKTSGEQAVARLRQALLQPRNPPPPARPAPPSSAKCTRPRAGSR
jgi:hypothetical protein